MMMMKMMMQFLWYISQPPRPRLRPRLWPRLWGTTGKLYGETFEAELADVDCLSPPNPLADFGVKDSNNPRPRFDGAVVFALELVTGRTPKRLGTE
mmetsp:Transcript_97566/g.169022  ORF Transcript_97566/g.169022 Transcript_97566/m.169022 type:complete len:96 (-) Transcript_97566:179-466(-)